jgi:uncharacterized protein
MFFQFLLCSCLFLLFSENFANAAVIDDDAWFAKKVLQNETASFTTMQVHVLRLGPGEDLLESLWRYARVTKIAAASVVSVVGSLTQTSIRYANQENGTSLSGHFEIVSVVGNLDQQHVNDPNYSGNGHIHMAFSDETGFTLGGHVLFGNLVYTTAEITLLEIKNGLFDRFYDKGPGGSGYKELQVFRTDE